MRVTRFGSNQFNVGYYPQIAQAKGRFILVSGPSGAGKGTVIQGALLDPQIQSKITQIPSVMTRSLRPGEQADASRIPISRQAFLQKMQNGKLFQWAFYNNEYYGTTVKDVLKAFQSGLDVILELAAPDALKIHKAYPNKTTTIFISPPPPEMVTLRKRLIQRGTDTKASIRTRLRKAKDELALRPQFHKNIVNHENQLPQTIDALKAAILNKIPFAGRKRREIA